MNDWLTPEVYTLQVLKKSKTAKFFREFKRPKNNFCPLLGEVFYTEDNVALLATFKEQISSVRQSQKVLEGTS